MKNEQLLNPIVPLNGPAVKQLEDALSNSPQKSVFLEINNALYLLSREGRWLKFAQLTKKRAIKRATLFETITEMYNQVMHGHEWRMLGEANA